MYMIKEYTGQNVYEALQERLRFIFEEFDNIFVSFSGGKDGGMQTIRLNMIWRSMVTD